MPNRKPTSLFPPVPGLAVALTLPSLRGAGGPSAAVRLDFGAVGDSGLSTATDFVAAAVRCGVELLMDEDDDEDDGQQGQSGLSGLQELMTLV